MTLQITCPKCNKDMNSTCELSGVEETLHLMEFEGLDFECVCGHKVHILSVEPRDENGFQIY